VSMLKEELHRMVDTLPEKKVMEAVKLLKALLDLNKSSEELWDEFLTNPLINDEPWTEEDEAGWCERINDINEGRIKPWEQVKKNPASESNYNRKGRKGFGGVGQIQVKALPGRGLRGAIL